MIDKSKQCGKTFNFKPCSESDLDIVRFSITALRVVIVGKEEANNPRKRDVPVKCIFKVN